MAAPDTYLAQLDAWKLKRLAALKGPEGWLNIIGRFWLDTGTVTVGSADDNDLVLPAGPAHVGAITQDASGGVTFTPADGGAPQVLKLDKHHPPRFSVDNLLRLVRGIAAAAAHLHGRGIHHGDLYAHNILCNGDGDALLGDFGAASLYAVAGPQSHALQRLEVRAFGVLLGELLARCDTGVGTGLAQLQRDCVQADTERRPLFNEIVEGLARL